MHDTRFRAGTIAAKLAIYTADDGSETVTRGWLARLAQ